MRLMLINKEGIHTEKITVQSIEIFPGFLNLLKINGQARKRPKKSGKKVAAIIDGVELKVLAEISRR